VNGLKDGVRAWDIAVCQIEIQCAFVHTRGNLWQLQERLDLRGKRDPVPRDPVVERLDPKTIPGNEEALAPAIPQGKRKHPLEQIQASFRALLIGMEDDLSIRPGSEGMASLLESAAQLFEIIDLAVERHPNGSILVRQRLTAAGRVDDSEPPRRQGRVLRAVEAFLIRAAVGERPRHCSKRGRGYRLIPSEVHNAADSAHLSPHAIHRMRFRTAPMRHPALNAVNSPTWIAVRKGSSHGAIGTPRLRAVLYKRCPIRSKYNPPRNATHGCQTAPSASRVRTRSGLARLTQQGRSGPGKEITRRPGKVNHAPSG